jgi:hypothetical protein
LFYFSLDKCKYGTILEVFLLKNVEHAENYTRNSFDVVGPDVKVALGWGKTRLITCTIIMFHV